MFALELKVEFIRTGFLMLTSHTGSGGKDKEMSRTADLLGGHFWKDI